MRNALPFSGLNVVDFGQYVSGPAVAMILADLGANVVHVDPPNGPLWKHSANAVLNRNKTNIRLDLKSGLDLDRALSLCSQADVIIENFRPGTMKKLGIDLDTLRETTPSLITLSLPGFASNDQLRKQWKATEAVIAASSGAFTDMGYNRVLMGCDPSFSPLTLGSAYATMLAASGVSLALFEREKSGQGDHIEVPVAAALMEGLSYNSINIEGMPERYHTMREKEITRRREAGLPMDVTYDELQEYLDPFYRTYKCKDGRYFYVVCPSHRNHARRCLELAGIYDELVAEGLPDVENLYLPHSQWEAETSIGVYPLPANWAAKISEKMKRVFITKTSEEWGKLFGEGGIPGAPHRSTQEWVNAPYSLESGLIVEVNDPEYGVMKQPGPLVWFEELGEELCDIAPRKFAEYHDAERLFSQTGLPRNFEPLPNVEPDRQWLKGVRVLDLTNVIAGPHSTAFLSRFGAEVIKLDPTKPMYDPLIGVFFSYLSNIGKKSLLLDMLTDEGKPIFEALVKTCDIVVINAPSRQVEPLGLNEERLKAINPDVIFCRLDCLGGPKRGEKTDYIGYDDIIQANSGIMTRFGGAETPEEHAHLGTLDVNCGFAAGLAMSVALYVRAKTRQVLRPRTSLSSTTNLAQIKYSHDYEGAPPRDEPSGREALGYDALSHFYQTHDGWLYLDATEADINKLEMLEELRGISTCDEAGRKAMLANQFKRKPNDVWLNKLSQLDVAAAQTRSIEWLRKRYSRPQDGQVGFDSGSYAFSTHDEHPSGYVTTMVDHYSIRPKEAKIIAAPQTERFGRSSRRVLDELGFGESDIQSLIDKGIVSDGWSEEFLPS
ncbi:Dimethylsulfoniopropionate (DMSP) acyl CoA transferase DddD [Grimontia indica]|uniref:Dimethylsulfoniopropionate (DMSP) acyl CoA transferase DddD n=1 Tax=Grimontia indica TaxID=1056512 RepID=R1IQF1_9GAMM|nr:CoA transferase [Grimontia indica]EOD79702.1 Dimethylsulfoniopropionate (DMSP) acyl CoA transferase DddD [Grimontia indica]